MSNGIYHPYQLDESISNLRVVGYRFQFHSTVKSAFCKQTVEPDQTPLSAASGLVLHSLLMSHKKDAQLEWVMDSCCLLLWKRERMPCRQRQISEDDKHVMPFSCSIWEKSSSAKRNLKGHGDPCKPMLNLSLTVTAFVVCSFRSLVFFQYDSCNNRRPLL